MKEIKERIVLKDFLLAAAIGDISGVPYEFNPVKDPDQVNLLHPENDYSDDTLCTFAIAEALIENRDPAEVLRSYCKEDLTRGFGGNFLSWVQDDTMGPYESWGNGSAMRVSSVACLAESRAEVRCLSNKVTKITHNHPEGMKGARATAAIIWGLLHGKTKGETKKSLFKYYPDWKDRNWKWLNENYTFKVSCQSTVPAAVICFLDSTDFKDCLIKCIAAGGDADTMGAIAAPMAYAYYKELPEDLVKHAKSKLPDWMLEVNEDYNSLIQEKS